MPNIHSSSAYLCSTSLISATPILQHTNQLTIIYSFKRIYWIQKFNWEEIAVHYEQLLTEKITAQKERIAVAGTSA